MHCVGEAWSGVDTVYLSLLMVSHNIALQRERRRIIVSQTLLLLQYTGRWGVVTTGPNTGSEVSVPGRQDMLPHSVEAQSCLAGAPTSIVAPLLAILQTA
jgi:hypothetical protein